MKTKGLLASVVTFMLLLSGLTACAQHERISGSGSVKKETRDIAGFKSIGTSGSFNVYISPGSSKSIEIEADDNILPYIVTELKGDELKVHIKKGYDIKPSQKITVNVSMPEVRSLAASGSGGFYSKGSLKGEKVELGISGSVNVDLDLQASKLEVGVSGSTKIALKGNISTVEYGISGSAAVDALALQSDNVEVSVSGSGDLAVNAQKKLDISISGGAKVRYKGNPSINQSSSGSAKITKID
jgi:hypothetical protein